MSVPPSNSSSPAAYQPRMALARTWDRLSESKSLGSVLGNGALFLGGVITVVPLLVDWATTKIATYRGRPLFDSAKWEPKSLTERTRGAVDSGTLQPPSIHDTRNRSDTPPTERSFITAGTGDSKGVGIDNKHTEAGSELFNLSVRPVRERAAMPVGRGAAALATALAHEAEGVDELRGLILEGQWSQVAQKLPVGSPERLFANAMANLNAGESGRGDGKANHLPQQVVIGAEQTLPRDDQISMARASSGDGRACAIGTTFAAPFFKTGATMNTQDGVYFGKHGTVVTDGLGGHDKYSAFPTQVTQAAAGVFTAAVLDEAASLDRPAAFLEAHKKSLVELLNLATGAARNGAVAYDALGIPEEETRAALTAFGRFKDGDFVLCLGDPRAVILKKGWFGRTTTEVLSAQPGSVKPLDVAGLGDLGQAVADHKMMTRVYAPGTVKMVLLGTDGVFNDESNIARYVGDNAAELVKRSPETVRNLVIDQLSKAVQPVRAKARKEGDGLDDAAVAVIG